MKRKPILLILNVPPPYGGGEMRAQFLKKFFSLKRNYIVFSYSRKNSNKSRQGQLGWRNISWGIYLIVKVACLILKYRVRIIYLSIPKDFIALFRTALIMMIAKCLRVKILGELPGGSFEFFYNQKPGELPVEEIGSKFNQKLEKKLGIYFVKQVDEMRVLGENVKKHLAEYGINKTIVIENGIKIPADINISQEIIYQKPLNLLYVGALNFSKGLKNLIYAINICKQEALQIHLHILGEWSNAEHRKEIEHFINRNFLEKYITFYGLITDDRKWEIYKHCVILTHPTYWDGQPLTILEAMGVGLGIISTPIGAIPDTVKDSVNGIILKENTPDALFKAIKTFYEDRSYLVKVSQNNIRTYNRKYTTESYCERMQSWFEKDM